MRKGRRAAQQLVVDYMNAVDKTGRNAARYERFFAKMNDKQFAEWAARFCADPRSWFRLQCPPFDREPSMEDAHDGLDLLGVPLDEYVTWNHDGGPPVRTATRVPVGWLMLKTMQQVLTKKNTFSVENDRRDYVTGQVSGEDRVARVSDMENMALTALGAEQAVRELLGPRADNKAAKQELYARLHRDGVASLADLPSEPGGSAAAQALDMYLLGAGLRSDAITPGMALPITIRNLAKRE